MNLAIEAALEIAEYLDSKWIPYVLIGGLAVQHWGESRLTRDADFTMSVPFERADAVVREITSVFPSRATDPIEMAHRAWIVLVTATNGVDVDLSIAYPGYEPALMKRATEYEIVPGRRIRERPRGIGMRWASRSRGSELRAA